MHSNKAAQATNLFLRSVTLFSKFALIFFLAIFLEPNELGIYGLLTVSITYAIYFVGFDFYTYSTRELLGAPDKQWAKLLRDQAIYFLIAYTLVLPALSLVFFFGWLPWKFAIYFFALLVAEHLGAELNRVLVAMSEPLQASIVLFFRSGFWALLLTPLLWVAPSLRNLETILLAWLLSAVFAVFLGLLRLSKLERACLKEPVDWRWLHQGMKVALPLLLGTIALRGIFTFDRYWMEHITSLDILGAYTLFVGVASAIITFLDAGIFVFLYPEMISAFRQGESTRFKASFRRLALQTIIVTLALTLMASIALPVLLGVFDKRFYLEHLPMFYWILLAIVLYALGMIPHYGLYATGNDRGIIGSHLLGLAVFMFTAWGLSTVSFTLAVPQALCLAFAVILALKTVYLSSIKKRLLYKTAI